MKKKAIPTAQMGRSNIQRRAFKSAGAQSSSSPEKTPSEGIGIKKYMNTNPERFKSSSSTKPEKKSDGYADYMKTVQGESFKISAPKEEKAPAKKKIVRTESKAIDVPKREKPSLSIKAPVKGIDKGPEKRKFSKADVKIMEIMQKGKKDNGTMKESAQRKIKSILTKERLATQKIRNKAERAEKRYEVKSAKAKVKAVRKSFKK